MTPSTYWSAAFTDILTNYISSLGSSKSAYFSYAKAICDYLKKDFLEITEKDVTLYFNDMLQKTYLKKYSLHTVLCKRSFYDCLTQYINEYYPELALRNFYTLVSLPAENAAVKASCVPESSVIFPFLSAVRDSSDAHYLLYSLVLRMALKNHEVLNLKYCDIKAYGQDLYLDIATRARPDTRLLLVPSDLHPLVEDYVQLNHSSSYLFINKYGNKLNNCNLCKLTQKYCKMADIEDISLQKLRNRAILEMIDYSKQHDLDLMDDIARQANLKQRRMYALSEASNLVRNNASEFVNFR